MKTKTPTEIITDTQALSELTRRELTVQVALREGRDVNFEEDFYWIFDHYGMGRKPEYLSDEDWLDGEKAFDLLDDLQTIEAARFTVLDYSREDKIYYLQSQPDAMDGINALFYASHADRIAVIALAHCIARDRNLLKSPSKVGRDY